MSANAISRVNKNTLPPQSPIQPGTVKAKTLENKLTDKPDTFTHKQGSSTIVFHTLSRRDQALALKAEINSIHGELSKLRNASCELLEKKIMEDSSTQDWSYKRTSSLSREFYGLPTTKATIAKLETRFKAVEIFLETNPSFKDQDGLFDRVRSFAKNRNAFRNARVTKFDPVNGYSFETAWFVLNLERNALSESYKRPPEPSISLLDIDNKPQFLKESKESLLNEEGTSLFYLFHAFGDISINNNATPEAKE